MFNSKTIDAFLQDIGTGANYLELEAYIVGGYVRNSLYSDLYEKNLPEVKDIDLVISGDAIDFCYRLQKFVEDNDDGHETFDIKDEFEQFKTIKINHPRFPDYSVELASARKEIYQEPAAFPKVEIIDDIQKDLPRRDFTINALLYSLNKKDNGEIIDYVGAIDDMQKGLIRAFHSDSFIDDPTRIYRAARFMAEYDFQIEEETLTWIEKAYKNPDFQTWCKKRKSRITIELGNIQALPEQKAEKAMHFLKKTPALIL